MWNMSLSTHYSISSVRLGVRIKSASTYKIDEPDVGTDSMNKYDTDTDTCCLGKNFLILQITNRNVDVFSYDDNY